MTILTNYTELTLKIMYGLYFVGTNALLTYHTRVCPFCHSHRKILRKVSSQKAQNGTKR